MTTGFRLKHVYQYGLGALILAILTAFLLWPIALAVWGGFVGNDGGFTFEYVRGVFKDPVYVQGLINALKIAVVTTFLSIVIALPLAYIATKYKFPGKAIVTSVILVPLILPPFVGAIGLRALLGQFGAMNQVLMELGFLDPNEPGIDFLAGAFGGKFTTVVVMMALHLYPILYLNISAALANLDPQLDEAALNLGAGWWRRFLRVTLPLIRPGLFAGGTIVFIWSFTELGTPLMFDYYTVTAVQVYYGVTEIGDNPQPYALVVVMLGASVLLYLVGKFLFGREAYAMSGKATVSASEKPLPLPLGILALLLFVIVTTLAVLPHIGVVLASFAGNGTWYRSILPAEFTTEHYTAALSHPLAMGSIANSLLYSVVAMFFCIVLGLTISYLTTRARIRGRTLLDSLAMLPLAVPGLVMAFGYVAMTLAWPLPQLADYFQITLAGRDPDTYAYEAGTLFQVLGQTPNPMLLLVIAYTVRRLPYIVRSASAGLEQTSGELEEAAANLGASPLYALRRVVIPLILANLIAGGVLVFAFSMLEVSDSLILAQKEQHYPITKAIFALFNRLGDGPYIASAMGVWGMALLTVTLVGASVLMGKKLGAIFRV